MSNRLTFMVLFFIFIFLVLIVRVYMLSVRSNTYYEELATRNTIRTEYIAPIRGQILDVRGEPMAVNELGFSLAFPPHMSTPKREEELLKALDLVMGFFPFLNREELLSTYRKQDSPYNHHSIKVVEFIPYQEIFKYYPQLLQSDYVKVLPSTKRFYPNRTVASHIIGYTGRANTRDIEETPVARYTGSVGKSGLERQYNDFLQGELGYRRIRVTAFNQEIELLEEKMPTENTDIVLSIDLRLQRIVDSEFVNRHGAAVIMDANSGQILAAGSYPSYDINDFVDGISYTKWDALRENPYKPFINKLINGLYPPASVLKMGVGMAFLEYAGVNENTVIETPEYIEVGGRRFRDWLVGGHGSADLVKSIKRSVDVYYYKLSQKAGIANIAKVLEQMGFGQATGIDLPNEFIGIVPSPEWKMRRFNRPWYIGDTIVSSIGQGSFVVTPMQVARYTALLATGRLPTPHLVRSMGEKPIAYEPEDVLSAFQKSKLPAIQLGMYQACNEAGGTAYARSKDARVVIACKTGTAQVVEISQIDRKRLREEDMEYFHRSHAWITGYFPYDNPRYVVTVLVEHGGSGGHLGETLARMANALLDLGYVERTKGGRR